MNYYNEFDPFAAAWLRNLIEDGLIPNGVVDDRSIADVDPDDLAGFIQCHFFAGIGGWSLALQLAGWPEDRQVWTGSPPCQPFSSAGNKKGKNDDRHLWPVFFNLISKCRPPVIFGEQVASAIRHGWFDDLQIDMEAEGYASAMAVLPACGVGAPHKRDRLFYVAQRVGDSERYGRIQRASEGRPKREGSESSEGRNEVWNNASDGSTVCERMADTNDVRQSGSRQLRRSSDSTQDGNRKINRTIDANSFGGFWEGSDYIYCRDRKYRQVPTEPSLFPLAHGIPNRVGVLRGAGNAIVPQVGAEFVTAYLTATS